MSKDDEIVMEGKRWVDSGERLVGCRRFTRSASNPHLPLLLSLVMLILSPVRIQGRIECAKDADCVRDLRVGSACDLDTLTCTNPFASGCLRNMLGADVTSRYSLTEKRICNTDDEDGSMECILQDERLNYLEIRIAPGDWESAIFLGWLMQILLSEFLGVPSTIETSGGGSLSFYDRYNNMNYPATAYNFEALKQANRFNGNCTLSDIPCAHVIPEIWGGQFDVLSSSEKSGHIESTEGVGYNGQSGWFIPKFLAEENPVLVSYFGFVGEKNRQLLAETFKRPLTWSEYCSRTEKSVCNEEDSVVQRLPRDMDERNSYFVEGAYAGCFDDQHEKNDCISHPTTCTGHIVVGPCDWSYFTDQQLYWNEIYLDYDEGYSYTEMVQIIKASNATKSNIMIGWWEPEPLIELFGLTRVQLPRPDSECLEHRTNTEERCSNDFDVRIGSEKGSCDFIATVLQKAIASSLPKSAHDLDKATRSPGYDGIKSLKLSNTEMETILDDWITRGIDSYGYDPRLAVCRWVADNIDTFIEHVPDGYPRTFVEQNFQTTIAWTAIALSILVCFIITGCYIFTKKYSHTKAMKYAQTKFLHLTLCGFVIFLIGAIIVCVTPSRGSCTSAEWFINVGYTLSLAPLLVKISAINKVSAFARRMQRIKVDMSHMYAEVATAVGIVILYMMIWTAFDPPSLRITYEFDENSEFHEILIIEDCGSDSSVWIFVSLCWRFGLLLIAAFLAFQSRSLSKQFNEAGVIATMCYSRFIFFVMLIISNYLPLHSSVKAASMSFLYSFDVLITTVIYFVPKFIEAHKNHRDVIERNKRRETLNSNQNNAIPRFEFVEDQPVSQNVSDIPSGFSANMNNFSQDVSVEVLSVKESEKSDAQDAENIEEAKVEHYNGEIGNETSFRSKRVSFQGDTITEQAVASGYSEIEKSDSFSYQDKSYPEGSISNSDNGVNVHDTTIDSGVCSSTSLENTYKTSNGHLVDRIEVRD